MRYVLPLRCRQVLHLKKRRARDFLCRERPEACSIRAGCRVMSLAPSTYNYRPRTRSAEAVAAEARLLARIREMCPESARYGYRRMMAQLRAIPARLPNPRPSPVQRQGITPAWHEPGFRD